MTINTATASVFLIPTSNTPQSFGVNLAGINYTLTFKWNDSDQSGWIMDVGDESNNPIACGLPLITGDNILEGLDYLGIQGIIIVYTNGDASAVPSYDGLGSTSNLYFLTNVVNG